ncbi:flagellar hook-length control protein FliK [Undibacterium seohonense]|uniref:Flagellar hook-length control protein FliK n=1 Tax=Undibacterium seohonense TaxID=1344950 RepID=A0ABR6X7X9_9BURK|nr:flagellar hook-length control protein FliK [Undibacterium seohonense]MBC3809059.1 flagellar hook-length control protein FliK [Undibacterium seohonense]
MAINFPRLDPNLIITTGVEAPTSIKPVDAIKQDIAVKLNQIGLGNQVKAEVIAKLEDGSYIAKIEGAPMRLDLPKGTHVGDNITLRLNRLTPRVSFLLTSSSRAPSANPINNKPSASQQTVSLLPPSNGELNTTMELQSTPLFNANRAKIEAPISGKFIANIKQDDFVKLARIGLGNSVSADVTDQFEDGSYHAKVGGLMLQLDLPMGTQVGDKLPLKLNRLSPYISFLIDSPKTALSSPALHTKSGNIQHEILLLAPSSGYQDLEADVPVFTAGTANRSTSITQPLIKHHASNAIANYAQALQNPQSIQTELSSTGQLISHLLGETNMAYREGLKLPENRPLISNATVGQLAENLPAMLETQLKQSVVKSGYFYESHVIDFLQGKKSYQELQQEPQSKIMKHAMAEVEQQNIETKKEIYSLALDNLSAEKVLLDQNDNKHQELGEIVRQQLSILEHNKFVMSGMLTPNIPFSWEVFGQDKFDATSHTHENQEESTIRHHSFLKVELPNLGVVAIQIDLLSNQVQLSMKSQTELAAQELNAHANQLVQSLELSGTHLQSFKASQDEQL